MNDAGAQMLTLAQELGVLLATQRRILVTAESCTAGGVAYAITQVAGSSGWFERGFIVYSNEAKQRMLGVPATYLRDFGAVSEPVARAMAMGALAQGGAGAALAVTGIAGPDGGTPQKPVGTVCFAWALRRDSGVQPWVQTATHLMPGDRAAVRTQSIVLSLQGLRQMLLKSA